MVHTYKITKVKTMYTILMSYIRMLGFIYAVQGMSVSKNSQIKYNQ